MSKLQYIGMGANGGISVSDRAANAHILINGLTGCGKSVRMDEIEKAYVNAGGTVICLDLEGAHYYSDDVVYNFIEVLTDGMGINLINKDFTSALEKQLAVESVVDVLSSGQRFGVRQRGALREAVTWAIDNVHEGISDIECIKQGLLIQEKNRYASVVYERLYSILMVDYFTSKGNRVKSNKLNVVSFKGIPSGVKMILVELYLADLWRNQKNEENREKIMVSLDEFQNLPLSKDSLLSELLAEARKYNLNLMLATQTLSRFDKVQLALLNQAGVKLFFQTAGTYCPLIAKLVEPNQEKYWTPVLAKLKVGQAIAVGELEVEGRRISRPGIPRSAYKPET